MPPPLIPMSQLAGPPEPERKLRLMETVRRVIRERRFSLRTEEAYTGWIRRYILFHGRRHPADLDAGDVSAFLSDLAVTKKVSASTQNQGLAALTFLYTSVLRRPLAPMPNLLPATSHQRLPVVMSENEVRTVLGALREPDRLVVCDDSSVNRTRAGVTIVGATFVLQALARRLLASFQGPSASGRGTTCFRRRER